MCDLDRRSGVRDRHVELEIQFSDRSERVVGLKVGKGTKTMGSKMVAIDGTSFSDINIVDVSEVRHRRRCEMTI
jgi:hypothetical protein